MGRVYEVGVSIDWILRTRWRAQMNDTPPGTKTEYSSPRRANQASAPGAERASARPPVEPLPARPELARGVRVGVLAGTLLGSVLLIVAEFTTLFEVHLATSVHPIKTVTAGSNHSYALIPIALFAVALAVGVMRDSSRPALFAIGLLGIVALVIALVADLPDANATGLAGSGVNHFVNASSTPGIGMYLETLGAAVLVITCGVGLMAIGAPALRPDRSGG